MGIQSFPKSLRVSAIGPKTAEILLAYSIYPDFIPDKYIAEEVVPGLGDLRDRWVLLPMADIAHDTIPKAIQDGDGIAHVITAYHTVPSQPETEGLQAVKNGIDVITFTSGSTARNFINLIELSGMDPLNLPADPLIACIGPKTAKTATDLGFNVSIVPDEYTITGLVEAIGDYFRSS